MVSCHHGAFQLFIGDKHHHVPGAQPQERGHKPESRFKKLNWYKTKQTASASLYKTTP